MNCTKKTYGCGVVTPIHIACINPNTEILDQMLITSQEFAVLDDMMRKPIHYAACSPSVNNLKLLVEKHHIDTRDTDNILTSPLSYACRSGQVENVRYLCGEGRSIINQKNKEGWGAIHFCARYNRPECLKILVEQGGADVNVPGPGRMLPMHLAAAYNSVEVAEWLCLNNGKVTIKDKLGRTPLVMGIMNGNSKIVSLMLKRGAPYDLPDKSENYPLHYAAAYGYKDI